MRLGAALRRREESLVTCVIGVLLAGLILLPLVTLLLQTAPPPLDLATAHVDLQLAAWIGSAARLFGASCGFAAAVTASALVVQPRALLLDEPLASVDVLLRRQLIALFRALFHETGTAVLYVTHDPREAAQVGSRIAIMSEGAIVQEGTLSELRTNPRDGLVEALLREP